MQFKPVLFKGQLYVHKTHNVCVCAFNMHSTYMYMIVYIDTVYIQCIYSIYIQHIVNR